MKNLNSMLSLLAFSLVMIGLSGNMNAQIVITEIMYNPPESGTDSLEYIELYNAGSSTVNLLGYKITTAFTTADTLESFSLAPNGYFILAKDTAYYRAAFGSAADQQWRTDSEGYTDKALNNTGETITLLNDIDQLVDSVAYGSSDPWPSGTSDGDANGGGASLVLCDFGSDNNDGANWSASTTATGRYVNGKELKANPGGSGGCEATGIINNRNNTVLSIYPNPAQNSIRLEMSEAKSYHVLITNVMGKIVQSDLISGKFNEISTDALPSGMYVIQLRNNGDLVASQKVVINK